MVDLDYQLPKVKGSATQHKSLLVARELLNAIKQGAYGIGDRLPAERTMAKLIGVSRSVVREALSALHAVGVVESYPGDGSYICANLRKEDIEHALGILEAEGELADWLEARGVVELAVAQLAIERADETDLAQLDEILAQMISAIDRFHVDDYLAADLRFHRALFQSAHNETLVRTANVLLASMQRQLWLTLKRNYYSQKRLLANSQRRHSRIVEALRNRDPDEMTGAMNAHFKYLSEELED